MNTFRRYKIKKGIKNSPRACVLAELGKIGEMANPFAKMGKRIAMRSKRDK